MGRGRSVGGSLALGIVALGAAGCGVNGLFDFGSATKTSVFADAPDAGPGPGPEDDDEQTTQHPNFEPTVTQLRAPPPISGGTLTASADGTRAFAADPDRDALYVVDLNAATSVAIALQPGDEPGRVIEDARGVVHVALRGAGMIADIDPAKSTVLARRSACVQPRGIAYDAPTDSLFVACRGGELVTFPAAGGVATRTVTVQDDLRDLVDVGGRLFASTFRSAQVVELANDGTIARVFPQPMLSGTPAVMWRLAALPENRGLVAVVQASSDSPIQPGPGSYGSGVGCGSAVSQPAFVMWTLDGTITAAEEMPPMALPVDVAFDETSSVVGIPVPGEWKMPSHTQLAIINVMPPPPMDDAGAMPCHDAGPDGATDAGPTPEAGVVDSGPPIMDPDAGPVPCSFPTSLEIDEQATAIAFSRGTMLVQTREPATLHVMPNAGAVGGGQTIALSTTSREDTGHDVFHSDQGGGVACATCHAEGADDARTWTFGDVGARRTPTVLGTIAGTAPYHWQGEEKDLPTLFHGALERMNGVDLANDQSLAFVGWLDALHAPPPRTVDTTAAARGRSLFQGGAGCTSCHSGTQMTNNQNADLGQGIAFQVPPLAGVSWHAPFFHLGCGQTLRDTFDPSGACASVAPSHVANGLTTAQLDDLETFLKSL